MVVMGVTDKIRFPSYHWYNIFGQKIGYYLAHIGVKLGLIKRYGKLCVTVYDKNGCVVDRRYGYNIITDVGIKHLGDILANVNTTQTDIAFMEPGSGTTTPTINDTDTETPLTPADRLPVTQVTRSNVSPFEVTAEAFISSTKYDRPQTINELCIFFEPDETGDLFARGVLSNGILLDVGNTATLTYSLIFR